MLCEACLLRSSTFEIESFWSYTSTVSYGLMTCTGTTSCFLLILYFCHVYRDIILSDGAHHYLLRRYVIAGSTTLFAILFCLVLGSCVLVQCIALNLD